MGEGKIETNRIINILSILREHYNEYTRAHIHLFKRIYYLHT